MPITSGTKLGPYEIISPLGAGGMGEVYRARDTNLNREVALKVLPEAFAADSQRMARFQREAQVLASLNHPNIASIYGLESSGGTRALVMELVEGSTLAEIVGARHGVPLQDALAIAKQIAEALEAAHEKGIIHRDLKPANVKVTPAGVVKVLDFGLARALDPLSSDSSLANSPTLSPTLSIAATQAGMILGTAAYMAPEQAKGKQVDRRADIWAFGCVLFEMLAGQQPFGGETISDVLASVILKDLDWSALPPDTPASTQKLLRRCVEKDPQRRLQAIGEARIAIEETLTGSAGPELSPASSDGTSMAAQASGPRRLLPWTVAGVAILGFLVMGLAYWRASRSAKTAPMELSLDIPSSQQLFTADGASMILSPDGTRIAYQVETSPGKSQIYIRDMDKSEGTPLQGAEGSAPFFSPDGQWIGYFGSDGKLDKISIFGGAPVSLCDADSHRGASWATDGTIVFTPHVVSPLFKVPDHGGTPVAVSRLDTGIAEVSHRWPQFLPDGKNVIFTASTDNNNFDRAEVKVVSLATGDSKVLVENAYFGRYLPSGFLTYISRGTLFAVPFDPTALKQTGASIPVLNNIQGDLTNGSAQLSFSQTGTAVYLTGQGMSSQVTVALVDRAGKATPLIQQPGNYFSPRFSPDGKRLALQVGVGDVYVYDLARATLTPLTFSNPQCIFPIWTPDGKRITCFAPSSAGGGNGLSWLKADGTGGLQPLTHGAKVRQFPFSWSSDAQTLAFAQYSLKNGDCCEIWMLPMNASGQPEEAKPFLELHAATGGFSAPAFSPDGHWLAYSDYSTGIPQVFVVPYPGPGGKWQVSVTGGDYPEWSRTGHELFFSPNDRRGKLSFAKVTYSIEGNSFQASQPTEMFEGNYAATDPFPYYDVAPDGKHFAVLMQAGGKSTAVAPPTVVLNWFTRVARLVAASQK